ncbi:hypothetical protein CEXT_89671 [Caerostris extrusa]|uniref:Uncharacterized protein n=1 Tax=Caerostris extrusa TaxID=172846 RepID=A0AAV4UDQ8_CAEEX|nr:hypothetical protein CEXT_89671 [Caerostris extrusa]
MLAKVALLTIVLVGVHATNVLVNTGVSTTTRRQDSNGNYGFSYEIVDANGASNSRMEIGDAHGNKQGNYHLIDTDGRARRVITLLTKVDSELLSKPMNQALPEVLQLVWSLIHPYEGPVAPEVPVVVAQPAPVVVEPVAHPVPVVVPPAPVVAEPVAHPAPVVVHPVPVAVPVAHPVTSTVRVVHIAPAVQRPLVALPTRGSHCQQRILWFWTNWLWRVSH